MMVDDIHQNLVRIWLVAFGNNDWEWPCAAWFLSLTNASPWDPDRIPSEG